MKIIKIVLPSLAILGCLAFSACDMTGTVKPTNTPFYNETKPSPAPSTAMPSASPDLLPNNSPGNEPPELIPNPTQNGN